jgi:hypothetical protein
MNEDAPDNSVDIISSDDTDVSGDANPDDGDVVDISADISDDSSIEDLNGPNDASATDEELVVDENIPDEGDAS